MKIAVYPVHKAMGVLVFLFMSQIVLAQSGIKTAAQQLANDPVIENGRMAICVIDVSTGQVLAATDEHTMVAPASAQKLLTTATALIKLRPGYRYRTNLEYSGVIDSDGNLNGSLYLHGYGDPTLGSPLLKASPQAANILSTLALAVQRIGIHKIKGQIIGDASAFESNACVRTWQWEDMGNYYAAGIWGLNWHENLHYLHFRQQPTSGQRPLLESLEPDIPGLRFTNELSSGARNSGDNAYIFGAPYQFDRYVRGTIPAGNGIFTIKGSIPNPPLLAAQLLEQRLASIGITAAGSGSLIGVTPTPERTIIHQLSSPPLSKIVERANMKSVNLYCESMLKAMAYQEKSIGSTKGGIDVIYEFWKNKGLPVKELHLEDGSGLSEANRMTANFMTLMLAKMAKEDRAAFDAFYASIPVAGRSGSMKNRLKGTAAEGRVRAKSGTLENVRALAGYVERADGKLLAYTLIANDYSCSGGQMRQKLERFLVHLCK